MADNTRSQAQAIARLEEAVLKLTQTQTSQTQTQSSLHSKLDEVLHRLASLETSNHSDDYHSPRHSFTKPYKPHMKLDIPRFDDADAPGWLFKIS